MYVKGAGSNKSKGLFYEATDEDVDAVRPMFELVHFPALATCSLLMEELDDARVTTL